MTYDEYVARYRRLCDHAERFLAIRHQRCRRLSREAGLCPDLLGIHPNNAMVSLSHGKPWRGVDYDKVRLIVQLQETQWRATNIVSAWADRCWRDVTWPTPRGVLA